MPTFHADDFNLKTGSWDHLFTEHALETVGPLFGRGRKSHWQGSESDVCDEITSAFQIYKRSIAGLTVTLAADHRGRSVINVNVGHYVGSSADGEPTMTVRLVLEIKNSGDAHLVTAFPV